MDRFDVGVQVAQYRYRYREERHSDEHPDESEYVFGDEEHQKCDKNREVHVGRDDLRIEVIRLECVDEENHYDNRADNRESTHTVSDDNDGNAGEKYAKNRDESEHEHNERKRDNIRETIMSKEVSDDDEPYHRQE